MAGRVVILNGSSSVGKSAIVDVDAQPTLRVGPILRALLRGYQKGAVAFADEGISVIVDEVILDPTHLDDWRALMRDREVRWIGVHCDVEEVDRREAQRGDRPIGLARAQMGTVHRSIDYDLELDTTTTAPIGNAAALARFLGSD